MSIVRLDNSDFLQSINFSPLPLSRPLLMVGHGTRDTKGQKNFLELASVYQALDYSRPIIPCFLELTEPDISQSIELCISHGYTNISVLPILLFAARHNKFDITNELDRDKLKYPQLNFFYGRHLGIAPNLLKLWVDRLATLESDKANPNKIKRSETILLFVGRGSSDPDANGDAYKFARMLWEGSGYQALEVAFVGITYPRLQEGFEKVYSYKPKRIIVLPHFIFTGALIKKIFQITIEQQRSSSDVEVVCLPEIGIHNQLLKILRERELEIQKDQVNMNCEMCKFRLSAQKEDIYSNSLDPEYYTNTESYHQHIWKTY